MALNLRHEGACAATRARDPARLEQAVDEIRAIVPADTVPFVLLLAADSGTSLGVEY